MASIRAQTFDDWELILFDDGSTDGSLAIARDHAAVDNRIRVVASEHVGLVSALQRAGGRAGGDLIARMDADDVAHRERLAKQVGLMDSCPDIDVSGTLIETTGARIGPGRRRYGNWLNGLITHEEIAREFFVECPIAHPTLMVGRAAFEEVGGYRDASWAEDYDLCMRLFLSGKRFAKVPEMLLQWRESPGRLSMSDPRYSPAQFRACKRHYLMKTYLSGDRRFHQWGAGQVGGRRGCGNGTRCARPAWSTSTQGRSGGSSTARPSYPSLRNSASPARPLSSLPWERRGHATRFGLGSGAGGMRRRGILCLSRNILQLKMLAVCWRDLVRGRRGWSQLASEKMWTSSPRRC